MLKDVLGKNKIRLFAGAVFLLSLLNIYCYKAHFSVVLRLIGSFAALRMTVGGLRAGVEGAGGAGLGDLALAVLRSP